MLSALPTTPTQTLFQVAVALIPVLLFGGALLGRRDGDPSQTPTDVSPRRTWRDGLVGLGIIAVVIVAMGAELIAINGTFDAAPSDLEIRIVVFALALGTMAVGLSTSIPWAQRVFDTKVHHRVYAGAVVAALAVAVISQIVVTNSIDAAAAIQSLNTASDSETTASERWQNATTAADSARSALLALVDDPSFTGLPAGDRRSLTSAIDTFAIDVDAAAGANTPRQLAAITKPVLNRDFALVSREATDVLFRQRLQAALSDLANAEAQRNTAQQNLELTSKAAEQACRATAAHTGCVAISK